MLRIGEFSKLCKTTIKALRYYDKIGLLKPAFVDRATAYRYYAEEQLETVQRIQSYRAAGMPVEGIARILHGNDPSVALREQRRQLEKAQQTIGRQIQEIDRLLAGEQQYTACLKNIDAYTVYYCRGYIRDVSQIRSFMLACAAELHRTNPEVKYSLPDYCCVIYPDEGYRQTNIFVEYAQSVDRFGSDTPVLKFKQLEPITAVSVEHRGGYETLREAYLFAVRWAAENGYTVQGDARERYIDGEWNCDDPSLWRTEVQLPVKPREETT